MMNFKNYFNEFHHLTQDLQQKKQHVDKSVAQTPRRVKLFQVTILCSNAMQVRRSLQYCGAPLIRARASLPMTQQLREALSIQPPLPPLPLPFALLQVTVSFARSLLRFNSTIKCV